ncbi:MAG: hypothetical protein AAFR38_01045 [Planctomycetota bacterium]
MKICALAVASVAGLASAQNLAVNGDFETGDFTGWQTFPSGQGTPGPSSDFSVTNVNPFAGDFAGVITNNDENGGNPLIKQANLAEGTAQAGVGQFVEISFWARGSTANGGVVFAEFFEEISGGGVARSEILGGSPLAITDQWQQFTFTADLLNDVSGGFTLQIAAITGAVPGSSSEVFIDNVDIRLVPTPGAVGAMGLAGLVATRRRRG